MARQFEYNWFYDDVYSAIAEIIREREGRNVAMGHHHRRGTTQASMSIDIKLSNSNSTPTSNSYKPVKESISLSELEYGKFIDQKYKDKFISRLIQIGGSYNKNMMSDLIRTVATDIYNNFVSPTCQYNIDKILDKVRISGYDNLTKEEKMQLFKHCARTGV